MTYSASVSSLTSPYIACIMLRVAVRDWLRSVFIWSASALRACAGTPLPAFCICDSVES
ncbi:hypothetical protein D3C83_43240 [compost metagenome]